MHFENGLEGPEYQTRERSVDPTGTCEAKSPVSNRVRYARGLDRRTQPLIVDPNTDTYETAPKSLILGCIGWTKVCTEDFIGHCCAGLAQWATLSIDQVHGTTGVLH